MPRKPQLFLWVFPLLAVWASMLACNLTSSVQTSDTAGTAAVQTGTAQAVEQIKEILSNLATQTAQAILSSPTPIPPSPTPLSSPTPTPTSGAPAATNTSIPPTIIPTINPPVLINQVKFRQGGTSAYSQKPIKSGEQHTYSIRTLVGQTLILTASSPGNDVYLDVKGEKDDQHLLWSTSQASYWYGTLASSQAFQITLTTDNPNTYYFLVIEIPANIYFEPGAYSANVPGYIDVDIDHHPAVMTRVRYLVYASAGQYMTVDLSSPNQNDLSLGVYGQEDEQVYSRYEVKNNSYEGVLPSTQGYYLDVVSVSGNSTPFTLEVTIK